MRNICVVVGSRANYSSIKSVMTAISRHPALHLQVVLIASALVERYGRVERLVLADGFDVDAKVAMLVEGETPTTMAKSTGLGLVELPSVFDRLQPDAVVVVGDRFEMMAVTLAAAYMNIPIAHTMGGEVSGTIDESIRHAITKFAHIHFPASKDAAQRIIALGEREESVHVVGCPRIDLVSEVLSQPLSVDALHEINHTGVGDKISIDEPFLLVSQHPVTTEYGRGREQILATMTAVQDTQIPAIVLWPNSDAGAEHVSSEIRRWRERGLGIGMRFLKSVSTETYVHLMNRTACLVGNSSSGIREGAYIGTPCVNVGTRQSRRERARNVVDVPHEAEHITRAIAGQVEHGRYASDSIYGDGHAGRRIANILSSATFQLQKSIAY